MTILGRPDILVVEEGGAAVFPLVTKHERIVVFFRLPAGKCPCK
jgi:hypothetical protein